MKYYIVVSDNKRVYGCHENKYVLFDYVDHTSFPEPVRIISMKEKDATHVFPHLMELYLVNCGDSYVPIRYYDEYDILVKEDKYSSSKVINTLRSLLLWDKNLSKKDIRAIERTIAILGIHSDRVEREPLHLNELINSHNNHLEYRDKF